MIGETGSATEAVRASNRHAPSHENRNVFESCVASEAVAETEAATQVVGRSLNLKLQSKM